MALIQSKKTSTSERIKFNINSDVLVQVQKYCKWAEIENIGEFFEKAAEFIFQKDKEWKQYNLEQKKAK